jgi:hypothetical protein
MEAPHQDTFLEEGYVNSRCNKRKQQSHSVTRHRLFVQKKDEGGKTLTRGKHSQIDEGYWDGLGEHIRLNAKEEETDGSEAVKITFARDSEQPPAIETSEDNNALDNGSDSIAVWTVTVRLITMKEANNTPGENTTEMGSLECEGDVSPEWGSTTRCLTGHQRSYIYTKSSFRVIHALMSR